MPALRFPLCLILMLSGFPLGAAVKNEDIAVSSTAIREYVRPVDEKGLPRPETYVFAQGRFFSGATVDRGLVRTTFADITKSLAVNLAGQKYYPTKDTKAADLLIMVHWGATIVYEDPQRDFNIETVQSVAAEYNAGFDSETSNFSDPTEMNYQLSLQDDAREQAQRSLKENALLLGYMSTFEKERRALGLSPEEISMANDLGQERYFVILMAYDNRKLNGERQSKLLWVTRLSVRAGGNNFPEALPTLAKVGSGVFGRNLDRLTKINTEMQRGRVDLGELQVIGPAETTAPTPQKQ